MSGPVVGFISPFWLPLYGGAEQYHFRLASALQAKGMTVKVFCGIGTLPDRENGNLDTERYVSKGNVEFTEWAEAIRSPSEAKYKHLARHYEFMDAAIVWAQRNGVEIALIGNPFNNPEYFHARELYRRLSDRGVKVGLVHHDLSQKIGSGLRKVYMREAAGWEKATQTIAGQLKQIFSTGERIKSALMVGSPLFFQPDFMITNTHWSLKLIDPLNQCAKIVLHPLMDEKFWRARPGSIGLSPKVDITMVNPQDRKNPRLMAEFIAFSRDERTFRILKGGWGEAFQTFSELIKNVSDDKKRRVQFVDYAADMREVYHSTKMFLFPSLQEGYGMTPVEAMYCGVPVLSSSYPPIMEAVGSAAYTLCPFRDPKEKWISASEEILSNIGLWRRRSLEWSEVLSKRQEDELDAVTGFLRSLVLD